MKHSSKFMAALFMGTMAGGVMALTSGVSQAGLKDDRCWTPMPTTLKWFRGANCGAYGMVEPNNSDAKAADRAGDYGRSASSAAPSPPDAGPVSPPPTTEPGCTGDCTTTSPPGPPPPPPPSGGCQGDGCSPPPGPPPPPTKTKSNRGFGNGEEFNGCKGKACFDGSFTGTGESNNTGKGPARR